MGSAFTFGDVADPTRGVPRLQAKRPEHVVIRMQMNDLNLR